MSMFYSCLAVAVPLGMDLLFDVFGKVWNNSLTYHVRERFLFGLTFVIPSIVYLLFRNADNIAILYIALLNSRNIGVGASLYISVFKELKLKSSFWLPRLFFVAVIFHFLYAVTSFYGIFFSWSQSIQSGLFVLYAGTTSTLIYCFILWFRITLQRNREIHATSFSMDEYTCIAYFSMSILTIITNIVWTVATNEFTWENRSERTLVFQMVVHFVYTVAVTIIPGRIMRLLAVSKMHSLRLKQVFVRFVSHEIRSPLHVVLAGLELLRADMSAAGSQTNLLNLELIEDMQSAGETAVNILNDLLQYENMDAGTLNLEQSWKPLTNLLQGKLKWVSILAAKKNVNLSITDSTTASEFGVDTSNDLSSPNYNAEGLNLQDGGGLPVSDTKHSSQPTPLLYVDTFRIDQVIRNLITNAMKFTPPGGNVDIRISRVDTKLETTKDKILAGKHQVGMVNVGSLRVEVADSGAGIASTDQKAVFGEFIQFNRNEQQQGGGSGLGLWISRRIVDMHDGIIGFTSQGKGMGTTFFVELPIYVSEPLPVHGNPNLSLPTSSTTSSNEGRISKHASSSNGSGLLPSSVETDYDDVVSASYVKKSPLRLSASAYLGITGLLGGIKVSPLLTEQDDFGHPREITKPSEFSSWIIQI